MELHLELIGVSLMMLALAHTVFPRYFQWKKELASLSLMNRQMMYVHAFFIALAVFLMGLLCWTSPQGITGTPLGRRVALGFGVFWAARLAIQFFGYSSILWKGKWFETVVHVGFAVYWMYLSVVFLAIAWASPGS
jgi:hypothetical protein